MQATKLKIKVEFNDDIRLIKTNKSDADEIFTKVKNFIIESYHLNKFMMQYKDDENDLITIVSKDDLEDAIQQAIEAKKSVKIFVTKKKGNKGKGKAAKKEAKAKGKTAPKIKEEKSDENENEKEESNGLTGNICIDVLNNLEFRKELISFLSTIVRLYQGNEEEINNEKMELNTCIVTALSTHPTIESHPFIKRILPYLNGYIKQFGSYADAVLKSFDVTKIEEIVNGICDMKKGNGCGMFPGLFMPFLFPMGAMGGMGGIFQQEEEKKLLNCPGSHGLNQFIVPHKRYSCDVCNRKIFQGENAFGCRICNWDSCSSCYNQQGQGQFIPPQPFGFGSFGVPFHHGFHHGFGNGFGNGFGHGCPYRRRRGFGCGRRKRCWQRQHDNNNNKSESDKAEEKYEYRADVIENRMPMVAKTIVDARQRITKEWKMKNSGEISLPKNLLVKYCGRRRNAMITAYQFSVGNENEIKPGEEFMVRVSIVMPNYFGEFSTNWRLMTQNGRKFGEKLKFNLFLTPEEQKKDENKNEEKDEVEKEDPQAQVEEEQQVEEVQQEEEPQVEAEVEEEQEEDDGVDMEESENEIEDEIEDEIVEPEPQVEEEVEELEEVQVEEEPQEEPEQEEEEVAVYEYEEQLNQLRAMGFENDQFLKELLDNNSGRIAHVINFLLQN